MPGPRAARPAWDLVNLEPVNLPGGGEEEQIGVCRGDEQVLDEVLVARGGPDLPPPAAPLGPVESHRVPLDVALVGDGDHHVLFDYRVLDRERGDLVDDPRAAVVPIFVPQRAQFVGDDPRHLALVGQYLPVARDRLLGFGVLLDDLVALEAGEAL
jgi:hypothetical protein